MAEKDTQKKTKKEVAKNKPRKAEYGAGAKLTKHPSYILKAPRVTEKALRATLQNAYVFEVATDATKRDVVAAMKALYKVTPVKVNITVKQPRAFVARFRNRKGTKVGMRKAYVYLKKGEKIELA